MSLRASFRGEIIYSEDKEFCGIDLGADHCAEHEWGVKELQESFGIPTDAIGIKAYTITRCPENLGFKKFVVRKKRYAALYSCKYMEDKTWSQFIKDAEVYPYSGIDSGYINAAWCSDQFIIVVSQEHIDELQEMYNCMKSLDMTMGIGFSGNPFKNGGLIFLKLSSFSEENKAKMLKEHLEQIALQSIVTATGIEEKLEKAGKRYYALKPNWRKGFYFDEGKELESKYDVVFFLNPREQGVNNFGWFTVENLLDWIDGKGPIVKGK